MTRFPSIGKSLGQLVGVLAIVVLAACSGGAANDRVLPDEQLEQLDGGTYDLRQTGEPRALNLWATWCAPCRAELPAFDSAGNVVEGAEIIGINVGESGADAAELVAELDLGFRQLLDPSATVQQTLRITGMPSTIFVDGSGQVVDVHAGELNTDELEAKLAELFGATFRS